MLLSMGCTDAMDSTTGQAGAEPSKPGGGSSSEGGRNPGARRPETGPPLDGADRAVKNGRMAWTAGRSARVAVAVVTAAALACGGGSTGGVTVTPGPGIPAGNPGRACAIPPGGALEDASRPTTVVGSGTPASCTPEAFESAVASAGVVTFDCGPEPVTITLPREVRLVNDAGASRNGDLLIDGGGKVTLSGGGTHRILYMNGCDPAQHWITDHCQDYPHPRLVVQNLTFADGAAGDPGLGGGAIYARSGQLKVVSSVFLGNRCATSGPDVAGGAIYAIQQAGPVYVVDSTFGAPGRGNVGSNGGALGSIGVSWTILNGVFSGNQAVGVGRNPARAGTPGGGSGGAIYNDGNTYSLTVCGSDVSGNTARELAGAVFFVSNDLSGSVEIDRSTFRANAGVDVQDLPGFFILAGRRTVTASTIE
jgi:hypothetical protein